ncbi:UNVERIFIED_CONTAM: polyprotein [Sesamum latifolium]|uniref:Polyprotein n=1 Tax=Sesamum latifolium TaxID=2727402 RepID=A0AAW2WT98_9LAMI
MEKSRFFIQLPFKLNEDANPIKASHPKMTPDDLALAREECSQLLALGLIEPMKSNWACQPSMSTKELNKFEEEEIPSTGHRILQTDASNEFWRAILIEEENGKKHFCGHASGQFKDSKKHYHAVYKEILAIKNGIKKFEFHLIGHHFTILMNNTSFPKIMDLKNKGVPEPQLLRLKDWFSKYQFTEPSPYSWRPVSSTSRSPLTFPPKFFYDLKNIKEYALDHMFLHLARLLAGTDIPQGGGCLRLDYPFLAILTLPGAGPLPEDGLWYLWCLAALYYFPIEVNLEQMIAHLQDVKNGKSLVWVQVKPSLYLFIINGAQRPRLVYTSLVIEPMDEDSDSNSILEPDSQDPWDYGTEINLESPAASFHHGRPCASA